MGLWADRVYYISTSDQFGNIAKNEPLFFLLSLTFMSILLIFTKHQISRVLRVICKDALRYPLIQPYL